MAFILASTSWLQHLPPVIVLGTKRTTAASESLEGTSAGLAGGSCHWGGGFLLGMGEQPLLPQERHARASQCTLVNRRSHVSWARLKFIPTGTLETVSLNCNNSVGKCKQPTVARAGIGIGRNGRGGQKIQTSRWLYSVGRWPAAGWLHLADWKAARRVNLTSPCHKTKSFCNYGDRC